MMWQFLSPGRKSASNHFFFASSWVLDSNVVWHVIERFELPTSAILILSQGSGWHGNLILGKEGKEGGGGGRRGAGYFKTIFFNTLHFFFLAEMHSVILAKFALTAFSSVLRSVIEILHKVEKFQVLFTLVVYMCVFYWASACLLVCNVTMPMGFGPWLDGHWLPWHWPKEKSGPVARLWWAGDKSCFLLNT